MASSWIKNRRMFERRKNGLFKKAFEIQRRCQARVHIVMEYQGSYYVYRNSQKASWPPPAGAPEMRDATITLPTDFQTVREADASGPVSSDTEEMISCPSTREDQPISGAYGKNAQGHCHDSNALVQNGDNNGPNPYFEWPHKPRAPAPFPRHNPFS